MHRQASISIAVCVILVAGAALVASAQQAASNDDNPQATNTTQQGDERRVDLFRILKIVLRPPEDAAVCVVVSREFVNAFFAAPVNEDSTVGATILGTYVSGNAETVGNLEWRLRPNDDELDLEIKLTGQCDSNTVGGNGPVDVRTKTNADFTAIKRVRITPEGIHSHAADVNAYHLKSNPRVNSRLGGLVGRIATNIGRNVVARNRGQVVSESRAHLQQEVGSQVDGRVDEALVTLRRMVIDARQSKESLFLRKLQLRTTDKVLMLATGNIPADVLRHADDSPEHEITLVVSRSLAERFGKVQEEEVAPPDGNVPAERGRRLRLLARLEPSDQSWSDDGQWFTLRWNVDNERIAWIVKTADKVKTFVESIDRTNGAAGARQPFEVRTAAPTEAAPAMRQTDARVRFFPFEIETQPPSPGARTAPQ